MSHNHHTGSSRDGPPSGPRFYRSGRHPLDYPSEHTYERRPLSNGSGQQQEGARDTDQASSAAYPASRPQTREPLPKNYAQSPGMTSTKRKATRSPDGSSDQRKILRNASMSKDGGDHQRKSSVNTNMINAQMDPRKRVDKGNASIRSPASTDGSTYQDAASSRSTPQPQHPGRAAIMTVTHGTADEDATFKKSLIDSLAVYTSQMSADAPLRVARDLGRRQLEHATAEFHNMESHFQKYPAIKERTTIEKDRAIERVEKLDLQLKSNMESQSKLAMSLSESIFNLFTRARTEANSRLPEPHPDAVSREEYDGLQDRFQKQQDLLDKQQDRFNEQSALIDRLEKTVKEVSEAATQARTQTSTMERSLNGEITSLRTRAHRIECTGEAERRTVSDHSSDIKQLKSDVTQNKSDQDAIDRTTKSIASSITTMREDFGKVERHVTQVSAIKAEISQIRSEISEPGKDSAVKRLKRHDQTINNIWTKVESMDPAHVELLEERVGSLADDLSSVRADVKNASSSDAASNVPAPVVQTVHAEMPHGFDPAAFKNEVLNDVNECLDELAKGIDDHGGFIGEHQSGIDSLSKKFEELEQVHKDDFRQLESLHRASDGKHTSANASIEEKLADFTSKTDLLQSNFESLSEMVKSLQKRPVPSASPAPAPANRPDPQQFRPLPPQSPRAPSPRTSVTPGSAQVNGFHPPNSTVAPHHLTNGAMAGPSNNRTAVTPDQIEGLWGSMHSLRQRIDNLTTEEVVKAMVDQASKMFPAAKEFQAAVNTLRSADKAFDTRLGSHSHMMGDLSIELNKYVTGQAEDLQKLQKDLADAGNATAQLRNEINNKIQETKKHGDTVAACQRAEIYQLKGKIEAFAHVAFDKEGE